MAATASINSGRPRLYSQNWMRANGDAPMAGNLRNRMPNSAIDTQPSRLRWACTGYSERSPEAPM
ncbi:hypothetical protein D3C72_2191870 [compost metagenome]